MRHLRLLASLLALCAISASAQTARLYTSADGLANTHIHAITQDSRGFIWISTDNGLSKFDGIKFTNMRQSSSPNSIASNTVRTVMQDSRGTLWTGTAAGLQILNTEYGTFTKTNLQDWSVPDSDQHITDITEIRIKGECRIAASTSGHGIYILKTDNHEIDHAAQNAINKLLPSKFISGIFCDSRNRIWVTSGDGGLKVISLDSLAEVTDIWSEDLKEESQDTFHALTEDPATGNIFIGTSGNGILVWDAGSGKVRKSKSRSGDGYSIMSMIPNNIVTRYGGRTYLAGVENKGIKLFDADDESFKDIRISNIPFNTAGWKVHSMMEDSQGNVWIGAMQTGVMIIPKSMFGFRHMDFKQHGGDQRDNFCVTSVISDVERDCLWVGTDGGGILKTDSYGNSTLLSSENSEISNNSITALALDKRGTLWVATYLGGLYSYIPERGFRQFRDQSSLDNEKIYCLAYSPDEDILYTGTHGNGFSKIDARQERVLKTWNSDDVKWISFLSIDSSGLLWIGTYNGPMTYDSSIDRLTRHELVKDRSIRVNSILESKDGNIWIGTGEGLIRIDRATREKKLYTEEDGLASNSIAGILEDEEGYLWISTYNGLSRFHQKTEEFDSFYHYDGLQGNEFNAKAAYKSETGRLYFGGINGLTSFNPRRVYRTDKPVPPLHLSNLIVMNRNVRYDPQEGGDNILDKQIADATQISLPYKARVFSLEFSVLEYTNPKKIAYEYMMEGVDKSWNRTLPGSPRATYTNIPSGRYKLKIKAFYEGEPEKFSYREIGIRILPPWHRSFWAWAAYIVLIILGTLAGIEYTVKKIRLKKLDEESEIKEMKLQMFTDISHEIRTPLTLVMNPLQKMREEENDPRQKELYNLMYRNSLRILRMVNQLLDMRKIDNGQMKLRFIETDIVYFIRDIMQSFANLADSRNISFKLEANNESADLWIDQDNFDKIIFNLLSNAFKHTPDGGEVTICLKTAAEGYMEIVIENTGEHIEEKHLAKLFERFYQADVKDAKTGSGVGLSLAKMLTELHHGRISAYNTDRGVAFSLTVPEGCGHLSKEDMAGPEKDTDLYARASYPAGAERWEEGGSYGNRPSGAESHVHAKSRKKVVLVDDDSEMRAYLMLELQSMYNVEVCANGKEAWAKISTGVPDAVITDLAMEKMDGAELCGKIKKNPGTNHIPVIILTSSADEQSHQRCIESGADRFFTKPISLEILKSAIAGAIATREALKSKFSREFDYGFDKIKMNDPDKQLASKVIDIIRKNLENSEFSVEELSKEIGISRVHLNRKLKETMNISPSGLIKSIRLKQAAYLLIYNKVNISEVAYKVGFSTHSYFSNSFHDYFGMTPKEFTAQYTNCTDEDILNKLFG